MNRRKRREQRTKALERAGRGGCHPVQARPQVQHWLERADAQLYRAKAEGRNRSCLEPAAGGIEAQMTMFGQSWFQTPE